VRISGLLCKHIEYGVAQEPTITTVTKIADALEVSIDELVGR
jgi:hypothetical protein